MFQGSVTNFTLTRAELLAEACNSPCSVGMLISTTCFIHFVYPKLLRYVRSNTLSKQSFIVPADFEALSVDFPVDQILISLQTRFWSRFILCLLLFPHSGVSFSFRECVHLSSIITGPPSAWAPEQTVPSWGIGLPTYTEIESSTTLYALIIQDKWVSVFCFCLESLLMDLTVPEKQILI